jgi:hypothetical protein
MQPKSRKIEEVQWLDTVEPREMTFLWKPYIPAGVATLMYGPGGVGKSHIAMDIAARVSTGKPFPGQDNHRPPEKVLIMSAEDEADSVLVPRLMQSGADLTKIAIPKRIFTLEKSGLILVDEMIEAYSVGIVFIDPIVSYIGGKVDINRANETREFTGTLHTIAKAHGVPIIIIGHSRKSSDGSDADKAMGSVDFVNAVRSALYVTYAPNGDHIMKHSKSNYAAKGASWSYSFGDEGFEWTGVYRDDGVREDSGSKRPRNAVRAWLLEKLADGPKRATDMERSATEKGFSRRTVIRGKDGVAESYLVSENGKMSWFWRLIEGAEDGEQAEVPVMGSKWGGEKLDRVEREILARTEERSRGTNEQVRVEGTRVEGHVGGREEAGVLDIDEIANRVLYGSAK